MSFSVRENSPFLLRRGTLDRSERLLVLEEWVASYAGLYSRASTILLALRLGVVSPTE